MADAPYADLQAAKDDIDLKITDEATAGGISKEDVGQVLRNMGEVIFADGELIVVDRMDGATDTLKIEAAFDAARAVDRATVVFSPREYTWAIADDENFAAGDNVSIDLNGAYINVTTGGGHTGGLFHWREPAVASSEKTTGAGLSFYADIDGAITEGDTEFDVGDVDDIDGTNGDTLTTGAWIRIRSGSTEEMHQVLDVSGTTVRMMRPFLNAFVDDSDVKWANHTNGVFIRNGTFNIDTPIQTYLYVSYCIGFVAENLNFIGYNQSTDVTDSGANSVIRMTWCANVRLSNFTYDCVALETHGHYGLLLNHSANVYADGWHMTGTRECFDMSVDSVNVDVHLSNWVVNHFYDDTNYSPNAACYRCHAPSGDALTSAIALTNCSATVTGDTTQSGHSHCFEWYANGITMNNCRGTLPVVSNNGNWDVVRLGSASDPVSNVAIQGGRFTGGFRGISIQGGSTDNIISGAEFSDHAACCIYDGGINTIIRGNDLQDWAQSVNTFGDYYAIQLSGANSADNCTIVNNIIPAGNGTRSILNRGTSSDSYASQTNYHIYGNVLSGYSRSSLVAGDTGSNRKYSDTLGVAWNGSASGVLLESPGYCALKNYSDSQIIDDVDGATDDSGTLRPDVPSSFDTTSGALTPTLGSGSQIGQVWTGVLTTRPGSNDVTLTVTNHDAADARTLTYNAVDEYAALIWTGTEWSTLKTTATES